MLDPSDFERVRESWLIGSSVEFFRRKIRSAWELARQIKMPAQLNDVETRTVERIYKRLLPIQNDSKIRRLKDTELRSLPRHHLTSALDIQVVFSFDFIAFGADEVEQHFHVSINLLEAVPIAESGEMI